MRQARNACYWVRKFILSVIGETSFRTARAELQNGLTRSNCAFLRMTQPGMRRLYFRHIGISIFPYTKKLFECRTRTFALTIAVIRLSQMEMKPRVIWI